MRHWRTNPGLLALAMLVACDGRGSGSAGASPSAAAGPAAGAPTAPRSRDAAAAANKDVVISPLPALVRAQSRIPQALQGQWRVVRQSVVGDGVQAYADDDPSLAGATLTIGRGFAAWAGTTAPLTGRCDDAYFDSEASGAALTTARDEIAGALRRVGGGVDGARVLRFLCMGEASNWGPQDELLELYLLADGRIATRFFDNLLLVLERT